jgi:hypothetical protein
MPPQPLLSVRRDAAVNVEPITLRQYPDLARSISDVIATWSQVECNLGVLLARMLGAAARPSMAMYSALSSSAAQMAALQAAADVALSRERLELFGALLILVKRAATKRNKIAHWLWGTSVQIPNALILLNPDAVHGLHTQNAEYMAAFKNGQTVADHPSTLPPLDLSEAFVYRQQEFTEILAEIDEVRSLTVSFVFMLVIDEPPNGVQYQMLTNAPQIRIEFEKARQRRQNP